MYYHSLKRINLIQNGPFRGCSELVGGGGGEKRKGPPFLPKICLTLQITMKLGTVVIPYL